MTFHCGRQEEERRRGTGITSDVEQQKMFCYTLGQQGQLLVLTKVH